MKNRNNKNLILLIFTITFILLGCKKNNPKKLIDNRNFKMGFTSWSYGPTEIDVATTYDFIFENGDIYAEHLDDKIPWESWINGTDLPAEFTENVNGKISQKPVGAALLLSISFLNNARDGIKEDFDGSLPIYDHLNDAHIEDAYVSHVNYLVTAFDPSYLVIAIESNDFLLNRPAQWEDYRNLMFNVRTRIKILHPTVQISESVTLHNWYTPDLENSAAYISKVDQLVADMDFAAISFYPFFKDMHQQKQFQNAFDFLHTRTTKPIAFVETSHLAKNLDIASFDLHIKSDEKEQEKYLSTLLINAYNHNYKFIIWWAYRDFDALWATFPAEVKELGKIWRNTGLLTEDGKERKSMDLWREIFEK